MSFFHGLLRNKWNVERLMKIRRLYGVFFCMTCTVGFLIICFSTTQFLSSKIIYSSSNDSENLVQHVNEDDTSMSYDSTANTAGDITTADVPGSYDGTADENLIAGDYMSITHGFETTTGRGINIIESSTLFTSDNITNLSVDDSNMKPITYKSVNESSELFVNYISPAHGVDKNFTYLSTANTEAYTHSPYECKYRASELPLQDYNKLVDLRFHFKILNLVCIQETPLLLIMIFSSVYNEKKRKTIRETWGKTNESVKILFMLAATFDPEVQEKIYMENDRYQDIIQGSFLDVYRNLTYKHAMIFKFVIYHCPSTHFVLKVDDDVFVNIPMFVNFVTLKVASESDIIYCNVMNHAEIYRFDTKWKVSESEYPGTEYPPYCPGWVILYSTDLLFELYKEVQVSKFFWIDDVHITGTLIKKLGKSHKNIGPYVISQTDLKSILLHNISTIQPFLVGPPNSNTYLINNLWYYVESLSNARIS